MIIIVHDNRNVIKAYVLETSEQIRVNDKRNIAEVLFAVAKRYPTELLIWVYKSLKDHLKTGNLYKIFHHKNILSSYQVSEKCTIPKSIGYVEKTPFTHINKKVNFPTWLMSSHVGGIWAETFLEIAKTVPVIDNFALYLTGLAKHNMALGLFCYSNPDLLSPNDIKCNDIELSRTLLFKFVKQHYKWIWGVNLFLCFIIFEGKWPMMAFLKSLFDKKISKCNYLNPILHKSSTNANNENTVDVVIPTLGRKRYLLDVLKDLAAQTVLPKTVIIVEQNPTTEKTELDYLYNAQWPFNIKHQVIKQTGACNARNVALRLVESKWYFLADDDIRFNQTFLSDAFYTVNTLGAKAVMFSCLQAGQKQTFNTIHQTTIFASGASLVHSESLKTINFDMRFEHGFGEDTDFGMQLRHLGTDIIYTPHLNITHLKAPIGGFRTEHKMPWYKEKIQPKPSPTLMLGYKKYCNEIQLKGIKFLLFVKFFKKQRKKNPITYIRLMTKQWQKSLYWSTKL